MAMRKENGIQLPSCPDHRRDHAALVEQERTIEGDQMLVAQCGGSPDGSRSTSVSRRDAGLLPARDTKAIEHDLAERRSRGDRRTLTDRRQGTVSPPVAERQNGIVELLREEHSDCRKYHFRNFQDRRWQLDRRQPDRPGRDYCLMAASPAAGRVTLSPDEVAVLLGPPED